MHHCKKVEWQICAAWDSVAIFGSWPKRFSFPDLFSMIIICKQASMQRWGVFCNQCTSHILHCSVIRGCRHTVNFSAWCSQTSVCVCLWIHLLYLIEQVFWPDYCNQELPVLIPVSSSQPVQNIIVSTSNLQTEWCYCIISILHHSGE